MKRLVLIDGHAILHRAYHAFPKTLVTSKGVLINASYGFTRILLSLFGELKPNYVVVTFDKKGPTFRHHQFKGYKATRPKVDQELIDQIELTHQVVEILGIPIKEISGFEADDVIGTIVTKLKSRIKCLKQTESALNCDLDEIVIVTGDKDALQLVDDKVYVYMPPRGQRFPAKIWNKQAVKNGLGVRPDQIVDLKALMGDASDDIPGVKGIGPKQAVKLLSAWPTLEKVYEHLDEVNTRFGARLFKLLKTGEKSALMSQKLAQIFTQVPIKVNLNSCRLSDYDRPKAIKQFEDLEFRSLINKLPEGSLKNMSQSKPVKQRQMGLF